jgi:hypothetical protein
MDETKPASGSMFSSLTSWTSNNPKSMILVAVCLVLIIVFLVAQQRGWLNGLLGESTSETKSSKKSRPAKSSKSRKSTPADDEVDDLIDIIST